MPKIFYIAFLTLLVALQTASANNQAVPTPLSQQPLTQLEHSLTNIDSDLEQLASFTLRGGVGSPGYRSASHSSPDKEEWIRIDFDKIYSIDQVILVPTLLRDTQKGLSAEGFPLAFRIIAGIDQNEQIIATVTEKANLLPRIAPLAVSFPSTKASWIRLEITTLSKSISSRTYLLQLSELFVFSGLENIALQQKITVSSPAESLTYQNHERYLIDGLTPYLMDAAQGSRSQTRLLRVQNTHPAPMLTLDLKESHSINQINLHTASIVLTIPMNNFDSWGVPRNIRITGANQADFSDQKELFEYKQKSAYDNGPIIMRRFPETQCRYIGITILDHRPIVSLENTPPEIAFSEIEVLSQGHNVAQHALVTANSGLASDPLVLKRLTDGHNYYGRILSTRDWMNQLSRRHDLERLRPLVLTEINQRHEHQQKQLRLLSWFAAILIIGITFGILIIRFMHLRQMTQIKERFAADLHDELGANLHTIGLLSDLAKEYQDDPTELTEYLQRIRNVTERSGEAVSNVTALHESNELFTGLKTDMERAARRIVPRLKHDLQIQGEEHLARLKPRTHVDLFLFYKESLINICRHSGASELSTHLIATPKKITLTITDNGHGIPESVEDGIPHSLKRRAHLLKATLKIESPQSTGTQIHLSLHNKPWQKKRIYNPR